MILILNNIKISVKYGFTKNTLDFHFHNIRITVDKGPRITRRGVSKWYTTVRSADKSVRASPTQNFAELFLALVFYMGADRLTAPIDLFFLVSSAEKIFELGNVTGIINLTFEEEEFTSDCS